LSGDLAHRCKSGPIIGATFASKTFNRRVNWSSYLVAESFRKLA